MAEHVADYLARRARQLYALSDSATEEELLEVCAARGVEVLERPGLERPAYHVEIPQLGCDAIVRDPEAPPRVLAHELAHEWIRYNAACGIDYSGPDWIRSGAEEEARRFSGRLCGEPDVRSRWR